MFLDTLIIIGINKIRVAIIAIKLVFIEVSKNKDVIIKAATAKAIPTP